ncbi:unnamed protein product [Paramecium pentaurelia]|uniref:Uncharacterized protein n=1 Tax=Paramecium pentaurelia TaxID=43138 RepID=A0A8S1XTM9_9CILI|nr:unnamed protein product [Paramecium pentaurelia]
MLIISAIDIAKTVMMFLNKIVSHEIKNFTKVDKSLQILYTRLNIKRIWVTENILQNKHPLKSFLIQRFGLCFRTKRFPLYYNGYAYTSSLRRRNDIIRCIIKTYYYFTLIVQIYLCQIYSLNTFYTCQTKSTNQNLFQEEAIVEFQKLILVNNKAKCHSN